MIFQRRTEKQNCGTVFDNTGKIRVIIIKFYSIVPYLSYIIWHICIFLKNFCAKKIIPKAQNTSSVYGMYLYMRVHKIRYDTYSIYVRMYVRLLNEK